MAAAIGRLADPQLSQANWMEAAEAQAANADHGPLGRLIPPDALEVVRAAGIRGAEAPSFDARHFVYPLGYRFWCPTSEQPALTVWFDGEGWVVEQWEYVPGPGPGDFEHRWADVSHAVQDAVHHFERDLAE